MSANTELTPEFLKWYREKEEEKKRKQEPVQIELTLEIPIHPNNREKNPTTPWTEVDYTVFEL